MPSAVIKRDDFGQLRREDRRRPGLLSDVMPAT
jgi:hypothetical protein